MCRNKVCLKLIFFLILAFVSQFFVYTTLAAPAYDYVNGVYTDDFANNTGMPTRSYVNVNTDTGKLQLTHDDSQTTFSTPYATSGYAYSAVVLPTSVAEWGVITFNASIPANTTLKIQVYDYYDTTWTALYEEEDLPGNAVGFSSSPIDISTLPIYSTTEEGWGKMGRLRLKVTMTTSDITATPTLDNLNITWIPSQGDLSAQPLSDSPWPMETIDNQGTFHSAYANESIYPAFKWVKTKTVGQDVINFNLMYNNKIFYSDQHDIYGLNRDTGATIWSNRYFGQGKPAISQNGTFYEYDIVNDTLLAMDLTDGSVKWTYEFNGGHGGYRTTIGTDGTIYFIYSNDVSFTIYAINPDGSFKWSQNFNPTAYNEMTNRINLGPDGNLYFASYVINGGSYTNLGRLYSLSPIDGSTNWSYEIGDAGQSNALVIDTDGTIYVSNYNFNTSIPKKIYAFNSDGTLKWERNHLSNSNYGYSKFSLRNDDILLALRISAPYYIDAFDTSNGDLLWSLSARWSQFFTDKNNDLYLSGYENTNGDEWVDSIQYYDANRNLKWTIPYTYDYVDGDYYDSYSFSSYIQPILDEQGWLYGAFTRSYADIDGNSIAANEFVQPFALSPWTLIDSSSISGVKEEGDTLNFSVTTSMLETNPLFREDNKVQVVLDGVKISLTYRSTDANGDTIWSGSYTLPKGNTDCGTHTYVIEAAQSYLQTDIETNFDSAPTESNNTGLRITGTFNSQPCGGGVPIVIAPEAMPLFTSTGERLKKSLNFIINNNNSNTTSNQLNIKLNANPIYVKGFVISLDSEFKNENIINYTPNTTFVLPNVFGNYTVYLKYISITGHFSERLAQTINYQPKIMGSATSSPYQFTRDLQLGSVGNDVKKLQQFLNNHDFLVAKIGPGSPGQETTFFGSATKKALILFQRTKKILPAIGCFGKITRGIINQLINSEKV